MKASNSRFSHRPEARYSNLAHVQGGLITDADLTEAGQIHQARDEALGAMALASGVPATGGIVALAAGVPSLRAGRVVAGGKAGVLALTGAGGTIPQILAQQADLPEAPPLPAGAVLLYADLWDRAVHPWEDLRLTDAGLHGAVTSYRTRTMVQIKALPLSAALTEAAALSAWAAGSFPFLPRGTALALVEPNETIEKAKDCDPCATSIPLAQTMPNALFRAEVLEVTRSAAGAVETVRLAWSMENAEAVLPVTALADATARDAFSRNGAAYEWLNLATEAHQGVLLGAKRPVVTDTLTVPATMAPAPTHLRRWDGAALATLATTGAITVTGGGALTVQGTNLILTAGLLKLTIETAGAQIQAGDHWLVELRRHAPSAERLHLVGKAADGRASSQGPVHRFCPLFVTTGNTPAPLDDATKRRLSFPALNDLPADHISFAPECESLFGNARNVQDALKALCSLNAGHIAYVPPCPGWYGNGVATVKGALDALCNLPADKITFTPDNDCTRFQGATNVAEALERLCEPDDSALLRLVLKTMMDWGVICGLKVAVADGAVTVAPGVALDREGRMAEIAETQLDLNDGSVIGSDQVKDLLDFKGEVCLALDLSIKGKPVFHLVETGNFHNIETGAFDPPFESTMLQDIQSCRLSKTFLWDGETLATITPEKSNLLRQVNATWTSYATLGGHTGLTAGQAAEVDAIVSGLAADYRALYPAEEADIVERDLKRIDSEIVTTGLSGRAADIRRMERAVAKIAVLERNEALSVALCECRNAHTPCPNTRIGSLLVPLACLTFADARPGQMSVSKVCLFCCRKQSLHWRSWRYYGQRDFVRQMWDEYKLPTTCCEEREAPGGVDWGAILPPWRERIPRFVPDLPPEKLFVWPPYGGIEPPDDRVTLPDVFRLPDAEADRILKGYGVEVIETLDLAEGGSLDELAVLQGAEAVKLDYSQTPRPGDRVVLLVENGKTLGTIAIGKGDAPLPYALAPAARAVDVAGMEARAAAIMSWAEEKLAVLAKDRETIEAEIAGLKAELSALSAENKLAEAETIRFREEQTRMLAEVAAAREGLRQDFADIGNQIATLKSDREAAEAEVTLARNELIRLREENQATLFAIRGGARVGNAVTDATVLTNMTNAGITTVSEAEALSETQLRAITRGSGLSPAAVRGLLADFRKR